MNLRSKNTKSSSGTQHETGGESNVTNTTLNRPTVVTPSTSRDNQSQISEDRLAKIEEVKDGWKKMVYAEFRTGARIAWDSFREEFKNIEWARKYLDEGSRTHVR